MSEHVESRATGRVAETSKHYIVRMGDTTVDLIGPFKCSEAAVEWGGSKVHNPEDDPRWQVVQLSTVDVNRPLALVAPY